MADWLKIKNEYTNGNISYRKLADKHGVSYPTLRDKAIREGWAALREDQRNKVLAKTLQKTAEVVANKEAGRISRILSTADTLLARIEQAADQLDTHIVTNKTRTKEVKYNGKNKPVKEIISEIETKDIAPGPIDRQGLQQVTAALKNIRDTVQSIEAQGKAHESESDNLFEAISEAVKK